MEKKLGFIKAIISAVTGYISFLLGGIDGLATILLWMMILDIITGMMAGRKKEGISSSILFDGVMKKASMVLVVFVATLIDQTFLTSFIVRDVIIIIFVADEGISFIENVSYFIEVPEQFRKIFKDLKEVEEKKEV